MSLPVPTSKSQLKRLKEWEQWLFNFDQTNRTKSGKSRYKYIPNAAWLLNNLYWRIAEEYLRPILRTDPENQEQHKIHPYKIIAASELTVMMTLPIQASNEQKEKRDNALFAWFVATQIIEGWETGGTPIKVEQIEEISFFKEQIDNTNKYPESFIAEHLKWLSYLNVTVEKPLLLLAQCWRLFYFSCLTIAQKGTLK